MKGDLIEVFLRDETSDHGIVVSITGDYVEIERADATTREVDWGKVLSLEVVDMDSE